MNAFQKWKIKRLAREEYKKLEKSIDCILSDFPKKQVHPLLIKVENFLNDFYKLESSKGVLNKDIEVSMAFGTFRIMWHSMTKTIRVTDSRVCIPVASMSIEDQTAIVKDCLEYFIKEVYERFTNDKELHS